MESLAPGQSAYRLVILRGGTDLIGRNMVISADVNETVNETNEFNNRASYKLLY